MFKKRKTFKELLFKFKHDNIDFESIQELDDRPINKSKLADPLPDASNYPNENNRFYTYLNRFLDQKKCPFLSCIYQDMHGEVFRYSKYDKDQYYPFMWEDSKNAEIENKHDSLTLKDAANLIVCHKDKEDVFICKKFDKKDHLENYGRVEYRFRMYLKNKNLYYRCIYTIRRFKRDEDIAAYEPVMRLITFFSVRQKEVIDYCGSLDKKLTNNLHKNKEKERNDSEMTNEEKNHNLLTFLQENDCSYEYLCEICPPKFIEIIKKEPHLELDGLYLASGEYTDLNMLHPFNERTCSFSYDTFEGNQPNIENLKKYNLYNVVAFNANIDKLRETWKDMPDMNDLDKDDLWPDHSYLYYSIEFGNDQPLIEAMFPKVFGEGCIMPKDIESRKELIEKYSDRCTPHRKFGEVNGKRRVIEED